MTVHDYSTFAAAVIEKMGLEYAGNKSVDDSLLDDWALDSIQIFQLVSVCEELAGAAPGEAPLPELVVTGDAHAFYISLHENYRDRKGS